MSEIEYHFPMSDRLQPRTEWRGGRNSKTGLLTLEQAARLASKHAGQEVTTDDFLWAAARGEIMLSAIVHRAAKVRHYDGGVFCNEGADYENMVPANSIPTLPLTACQQLANVGRATWRTFDGFEEVNGVLMRYAVGMLTDDESDFETVLADCRVTGNEVHALADAFVVPASETSQEKKLQYEAVPLAIPATNSGLTTAPPEATQENLAACPSKRWTPENLAVLRDYRDQNGTKKAAEKFGVSTALVRKKLPRKKTKTQGYSAFTHYIK